MTDLMITINISCMGRGLKVLWLVLAAIMMLAAGAVTALAETVTTAIGVGTSPNAVAVNLVTNRIYVANDGGNNVTLITEQQTMANGISTTITPLTGDRSSSLSGGPGKDKLVGFTGADTYIFNLGDGQDEIIDWGYGLSDTDEILFGPGITPAVLVFGISNGLHLLITYGAGDRIKVNNWFYSTDYRIEQFHFAWDDSTLSDTDLDGLVTP
ncbi:MAG: hypothetical protein KJ950_06360 [Proteobacteria bacterium]|nr:hypothetical protein [Pseudomonadota bacterium]MBU1687155.1 hypothetical protein [Pseudomonadota bacterium]